MSNSRIRPPRRDNSACCSASPAQRRVAREPITRRRCVIAAVRGLSSPRCTHGCEIPRRVSHGESFGALAILFHGAQRTLLSPSDQGGRGPPHGTRRRDLHRGDGLPSRTAPVLSILRPTLDCSCRRRAGLRSDDPQRRATCDISPGLVPTQGGQKPAYGAPSAIVPEDESTAMRRAVSDFHGVCNAVRSGGYTVACRPTPVCIDAPRRTWRRRCRTSGLGARQSPSLVCRSYPPTDAQADVAERHYIRSRSGYLHNFSATPPLGLGRGLARWNSSTRRRVADTSS